MQQLLTGEKAAQEEASGRGRRPHRTRHHLHAARDDELPASWIKMENVCPYFINAS